MSPLPNYLGLENWVVHRFDTHSDPESYVTEAEYQVDPDACPHCGVTDPPPWRHGYPPKLPVFMDTPFHGRRSAIVVRRRRYRCRETACGKTSVQPLPDMDPDRLMTKRLREYVGKQAVRRTFTEVAHSVGVDEKTVRTVFREYVAELDASTTFVTPRWLGIDELHLKRALRCVLTNVDQRTIVEMLDRRDKPFITQTLLRMPGRLEVEAVSMDMWRPYRDAVAVALPQAFVVVDKFHVVRMASKALEDVRKAVRDGLTTTQRRKLMRERSILHYDPSTLDDRQLLVLDTWLSALPQLRQAYDANRAFYAIFDAADAKEAEERHRLFRSLLTDPMVAAKFRPTLTSWRDWKPQILAYFSTDRRITNAYTEAVNGLAKVINRMGRGYSFEAIRAKVLYSGEHRITKVTSLRTARSRAGMAAFVPAVTEDFGVSIPQLTASLIEHQ